MLGLTGPHRTGKTTLAQAYAQRHGIPFVKTSATEVFTRLGRDPAVDYPIEERLAIQEAILHAFEKQYAAACRISSFWVADRTPIDMASYMLADVSREALAGKPELSMMVDSYVNRCIEATNSWFSVVALIQPGIKLVAAEGKAPICVSYMRHLNILQKGLLVDGKLGIRHFVMPSTILDLEERMKNLDFAMEKAINDAKAASQARAEAGVVAH